MIRSTEEFRSLLKAARRAGTPLLAVRTAGPKDVLLALHKGAAVKQFADAIVFFNNP